MYKIGVKSYFFNNSGGIMYYNIQMKSMYVSVV